MIVIEIRDASSASFGLDVRHFEIKIKDSNLITDD